MYLLLSLLLFATPAVAEPSIAEICKEVTIEVTLAIEEGTIDRDEAAGILQGCVDLSK